MKTVIVYIFLLVMLSTSVGALAEKDLLIISSSRNAELLAEAALTLKLSPNSIHGSKVYARTAEQWVYKTPIDTKQEILNSVHTVLMPGVYGSMVDHLISDFKTSSKTIFAFNSDYRLTQLSRYQGQYFFNDLKSVKALSSQQPNENFDVWLKEIIKQNPTQQAWLGVRAYWQAGGVNNVVQLFNKANQLQGIEVDVKPAAPVSRLRWLYKNQISDEFPTELKGHYVALIDHPAAERPADKALSQSICQKFEQQDLQCVTALAYWGEAGVESVASLVENNKDSTLSAIVMLQDFVIGGGQGRETVTQHLKQLNVPVVKAIKLRDRTEDDYLLSYDGLAHDKVYYQVAMPELQGASQPIVIATAGESSMDEVSGIELHKIAEHKPGATQVVERIANWHQLKVKANADKKIAIVYYNHPPGRHNVGADNLDVPASLWQILNDLKTAGYKVDGLPKSQEALLDLIQKQGINLPNDAKALADQANRKTINIMEYRTWFANLPLNIQSEMQYGPLGLLHENIVSMHGKGKAELADEALHHTMEEIHHLFEGLDHPARDRALTLMEKIEHCYEAVIDHNKAECLSTVGDLIKALQNTGIEGIAGWGEAPGKVMTWDGKLLMPGIEFGNVFIGPQPPRGWEINEELLHANLAFPPPHQYLAYYFHLSNQFKADAIVHLGRHSTYEFLPRRSVGVAYDDYSSIIAGHIPGIYPYIVDGVGEGIQAKRRGLAVMVDHLTPPLKSTALYDELLQLRQLVESFEANHAGGDNEAIESRLIAQIRQKVDELELKEEMAAAMSAELAIMGISFDEVDDDLLVHEIGHYLTDLQERFMPLGLHVFAKPWEADAVDLMLESMAPDNEDDAQLWKNQLVSSTTSEKKALLNGLSAGYIEPGQGNDPIRSPTSLPTGRNFYALDSSLIPSQMAWQLGQEMASNARKTNLKSNTLSADKKEAVILWASDVVRDEGVMIAFGLELLGIEPVWNSRGIVKDLKRKPRIVGENCPEPCIRRDVLFTTSGLFRDLYAQQIYLLNKATLMALDASRDTIIDQYPALTLALSSALQSLGDDQQGGSEPLSSNQVAQNWVTLTRELMATSMDEKRAGVVASLRLFGDAPGTYGAGINRLVERSGSWEKREELAKVYIKRLGHAYSEQAFGEPLQKAFESQLSKVENTYFGRSSNLYGLIDNNDAFDYLGGLSLSVETLTGKAPNNFVMDHSDPQNVKISPLATSLRQELRGRFLNPEWLSALMEHEYAGARTMGSEFLEYLWGWQVTNPSLVGDWAWNEVNAVYIQDKYELGLDEFLQQGHNVHVKTNMLAIMLVAIEKGFWNADEATTKAVAQQFVELVAEHGLPGSGHTDPDHPMLEWLPQHLNEVQQQKLAELIQQSKVDRAELEVYRVSEISASELDAGDAQSDNEQSNNEQAASDQEQAEQESTEDTSAQWQYLALGLLLVLIVIGYIRGTRKLK